MSELQSLIQRLSSTDSLTRQTAIKELVKQFSDYELLPDFLMKLSLCDPSVEVRRLAIYSLSKMQRHSSNQRASRVLATIVSNAERGKMERAAAYRALLSVNEPEPMPSQFQSDADRLSNAKRVLGSFKRILRFDFDNDVDWDFVSSFLS